MSHGDMLEHARYVADRLRRRVRVFKDGSEWVWDFADEEGLT